MGLVLVSEHVLRGECYSASGGRGVAEGVSVTNSASGGRGVA